MRDLSFFFFLMVIAASVFYVLLVTSLPADLFHGAAHIFARAAQVLR